MNVSRTVQKLLFFVAAVSVEHTGVHAFGTSDWNQDTCASGYTKHKILEYAFPHLNS